MATNPKLPRNADNILTFASILSENDPTRAAFYVQVIEQTLDSLDIPMIKMIDRAEYNNPDPRDHPPVLEDWVHVEQTDIEQLNTSAIKKNCLLYHRLRALYDMLPMQREHTLIYEQKLTHTIDHVTRLLIGQLEDFLTSQLFHDEFDTAFYNARVIIDNLLPIPRQLETYVRLIKTFDNRRADWYMQSHRNKRKVSHDPQIDFILNAESSGLSLEEWIEEEKRCINQTIHNCTDIKAASILYLRLRCLLGIYHIQNIKPGPGIIYVEYAVNYYNKLVNTVKVMSCLISEMFAQEGHQHEVWDGRIKPMIWARNMVNSEHCFLKIENLEPLPDRPFNMDATVEQLDILPAV